MTIIRLCSQCSSTATHGNRCAKHRRRDRRPSAAKRGYDHRWRAFRASYLAIHPLCEHESGCSRQATHVHHLDGTGPKAPKGMDPSNCQPLCASHHMQLTAVLQPGGWHRGAGDRSSGARS
jgi:5-methylcytosine-specific restriction protein A